MPARPKVPETTIVDIAAAAGVSVTTVSRIINDKPDVAEDTRERVMRLMEETGFVPQSAWRQIRSGRSGLIALHVPADFNPPSYRVDVNVLMSWVLSAYPVNPRLSFRLVRKLFAVYPSAKRYSRVLARALNESV